MKPGNAYQASIQFLRDLLLNITENQRSQYFQGSFPSVNLKSVSMRQNKQKIKRIKNNTISGTKFRELKLIPTEK